MTDYQRTITHETTTADPAVRPVTAPRTLSAVGDPVQPITRTTETAHVPPGPSAVTVISRLVVFLFGVLQVALILRVVLLVLVANPDNQVVDLILRITDPFVEPFRGMFALDRVGGDQGSVLDVAAIVALIGWTLVEALILALLRVFDRRSTVVA